MKKITTLFLAFSFAFAIAQTTTCSLDPVFVSSNKNGIWPDSVVNFVQGTVGFPYSQNITVKVPKDTVASGITICFNRVEVSSAATYTNLNLPPGLNLLAGPTVTNSSGTYKFPGNANSCAVISGTPTTAGTYTLHLSVQPYLTPSFSSCGNNPNYNSGSASLSPATIVNYYVIKINSPLGIKEDVNSKTLNVSNVPNPFSGKTAIKFTVKDEANAKICVYNLLGDKIFEDTIKTTYGDNSYDLDGTNWSNGMYLFTINYKNFSETKRIVLAGNR